MITLFRKIRPSVPKGMPWRLKYKMKEVENDSIRIEFIRSMGIKEMRIKNQQVYSALESMIEEIETELRAVSLQGIYGRAEGETL